MCNLTEITITPDVLKGKSQVAQASPTQAHQILDYTQVYQCAGLQIPSLSAAYFDAC